MFTLRQQQFLWMIFSPDLLSKAYRGNSKAFRSTLNRRQIQHLLSKIDENEHINALGDSIRLGILFESLLYFYLSNVHEGSHNDESRIYRNAINRLQVNSLDKPTRTLGEFDFLYTDRQSHSSNHLEAAVKFYLADVRCIKDLNKLSSWIGPGKNDRLDLKINKLFNQQLQLTHRPEAKIVLENHCYSWPIEKYFFLKGILFLPYALAFNNTQKCLTHLPDTINPKNEFGYWINIGQVEELLEKLRFAKILHRQEWLTFSTIVEDALYDKIQNKQLTNMKEGKYGNSLRENIVNINNQSEINSLPNRKHTIAPNGYTDLIANHKREQFIISLTQKLNQEKKPFQVSGIRYLEEKTVVNRYFIVPDDWSATTTPSCNQ